MEKSTWAFLRVFNPTLLFDGSWQAVTYVVTTATVAGVLLGVTAATGVGAIAFVRRSGKPARQAAE